MSEILLGIAERYLNHHLSLAQYVGILGTYGKSPDLSKSAVTNRVSDVHEDLQVVKNMKKEYISTGSQDKMKLYELRLVESKLESELFELNDLKEYETSIFPYFETLMSINYVYTSRSYAPLDTRIKHIVATEKAVPQLINQALENLEVNLPRDKLTVGLMAIGGVLPFLKDELIGFVSNSEDDKLIQEWSDVNSKAIEAIEMFVKKLETEYMPRTKPEFAIGEKKYRNLLKHQEFIDIDLRVLEKVAKENLEANSKALQQILEANGENFMEEVKSDHPKSSELLDAASESTLRAKKFVVDTDLCSIPPGDDPVIQETPKAMQSFVFAQMNTADIAEDTGTGEAYYYVTPPNPNWDKERTDNYMKGWYYGSLDGTSIHEVWPGHHLHILHIKQQKSKIIRQLGFAITTLEGWAHYTEELAFELGYDLYDPTKFRVGQLQAALMRNCRFVASLAMHTGNMTMEQAQQLFEGKAKMGTDSAAMEARRGTIDPMYLNYTLGKLLIMKLREDYRKQCESQGKEFVLKEFHDEFLSYGASPIPLTREMMLENPGTSADYL
ncbi:MAG: hypothetical protein HeimC2_25690 [Candidatus Heimdallarchaeota archaeon LC_2]|nr:MAG: hypothetical protein HeimC2_25690 [Candidatus Heimdallarchaeota archaeon LC_2]